METFTDEIKYGFSLFPFAVLIALGFFLSSLGSTLVQVLAGAAGLQLSRSLLLAGILLLQTAGIVVAAAGIFGGLHRVIQDAEE